MTAEPLKPIYSSRAHEPEWDEAVDRFVVGLGERVDQLQDAEAAGGFEPLGVLARDLVQASEKTGYGELSSAGNTLATACSERDAKLAREATLEITEIAQRVRLGHKGAV